MEQMDDTNHQCRSQMDEAIILGSTIEPISNEKDMRFAKGLCKIEIVLYGRMVHGSGFLCKFQCSFKRYAMGMFTNHHVLDDKRNYFMTIENNRYEITDDQIESFWTIEDIDVAFVAFKKEFAQELIDKDGCHFFEVSYDCTAVGSSVTILQHPEGGDASVSRGKIEPCSNDTLHHTASTLPGSSGSPLLDINYRVIGIHKRGKYFLNDEKNGPYNIGTPIKRATDFIRNSLLSQLILPNPLSRLKVQSVDTYQCAKGCSYILPDRFHPERNLRFSSSDNFAQTLKETYSFRGMLPVSMVFDRKYSVDWNTVKSLFDYRERWKKMVQEEKSDAELHFPPISLTLDDGTSTMLVLLLKRPDAAKISVYGGHYEDADDETSPLKLSMTMDLFLSLENPGIPTCSIKQKVKMERKGDKGWNKLLTFKNIDWGDLSSTPAPRAELMFQIT